MTDWPHANQTLFRSPGHKSLHFLLRAREPRPDVAWGRGSVCCRPGPRSLPSPLCWMEAAEVPRHRLELPTRSTGPPPVLSGSPAAAGPAPQGPVKPCCLRVQGQGFSTGRWGADSSEQRLGPRPSREQHRPAQRPPHPPLCSPCLSDLRSWKGTGPRTSHQAGGRASP